MFHMKEVKSESPWVPAGCVVLFATVSWVSLQGSRTWNQVGGCACVLVLLFSGFVTCSGVFGSALTDDVATLKTLGENIPNDYKIPVRYISKEVGGACWLLLNLYPVESSLKTLALKFGNLSSNRENITIFITMLQGLRLTVDNEELEATMQLFKCHYRSASWSNRHYFDHVREVLVAFASTPHQFHCAPPPCDVTTAPPRTPGQGSPQRLIDRAMPGLLALLLISCVAMLTLALRTVKISPSGLSIRRQYGDMLCRRTRYAGGRHDAACRAPGTDAPETRSSPELCSVAPSSDPKSCPPNTPRRVTRDSLRSEDTAV